MEAVWVQQEVSEGGRMVQEESVKGKLNRSGGRLLLLLRLTQSPCPSAQRALPNCSEHAQHHRGVLRPPSRPRLIASFSQT